MRTDDRHARAGSGCSGFVLPCGRVPCSRQHDPHMARRMAVRILWLTIVLTSAASHLPWAGEQALAQPAAPNASEETLRQYAQRNQIRQAYGVYLAGKKVGWFIEELRVGEHEGQAVALLADEAKFSVQFLGLKSETEMHSTTAYMLEGDGEIIFASDRTIEDDSETEILAKRQPDGMLVTTKTGGQTTERRVAVPKDTLGQTRRLDRWLEAERKQGDTFETYTASWDQTDVDTKTRVIFQERSAILWGGVPTEVYRVDYEIQGARGAMTLGPGGRVLEGKLGGLLDLRAEKEDMARRLDGEAVDLLTASAVRVDRPLGDSETIRSLKLRVLGFGDFAIPASHRQRVSRQDDGAVLLELERDSRVAQASPLDPEQRSKWLESTPTLQSDHPKLREQARQIVGDEKDPLTAARKLADWVFGNLHQTYAANASTALQILDNRAGDCSEHALLLVALARAAGIPAREVGGLAYPGDKPPLFGWHAWTEIHDGSQWVSVDPMWNQVYVDATHIKLTEDVSDLSWFNVVGRLKLHVVDAPTQRMTR